MHPPYSRKLFCCLPPGQCYHVPCSLEPSPEKRKRHLEQPAQVGPTRTAPLAGPPARHRPGDRCHFPALGCGTRSQGSRKGKARRGRETTAPGGPAGRVPALGLAGLSLSLSTSLAETCSHTPTISNHQNIFFSSPRFTSFKCLQAY